MIKNVSAILLLVFLIACNNNKEDGERYYLEVKDVHLQDIGKVGNKFYFESSLKGDSLVCKITTRDIKKNDTIKSIDAYIENNQLTVYALSSPNDFDCIDTSCFTAHELCFTILSESKSDYPIQILINNSVQTYQLSTSNSND